MMKFDVNIKHYIAILLCFSLLLCGSYPVYAETEIETEAKSVILIEATTGTVLYERNADEKLPPASVTKIMTLLLVMEAIDNGKIQLTDTVTVSERAAKMGGSQVYLEVGEQMCVDEMLKCVVIASANDAAAALAEYIAGSLEAFVEKMNERAEQLEMKNTHFENTNGLDDTTENHVTTARDIALMSAELLKHKKILDYTTVWMDTIRNGAFGLTNTNRLIRYYSGANGLKTGSTSKAGFCISATALRNDLQLIAVVMASPTRDERNSTAAKLLDYGFANYEFYHGENPELPEIPVIGGKEKTVAVSYTVPGYLIAKGDGKKIEMSVTLPSEIAAPVHKGDVVGEISYLLEGKLIGKEKISSSKDVDRLGFWNIVGKIFGGYTLF